MVTRGRRAAGHYRCLERNSVCKSHSAVGLRLALTGLFGPHPPLLLAPKH